MVSAAAAADGLSVSDTATIAAAHAASNGNGPMRDAGTFGRLGAAKTLRVGMPCGRLPGRGSASEDSFDVRLLTHLPVLVAGSRTVVWCHPTGG
jgi:hypothetical protein